MKKTFKFSLLITAITSILPTSILSNATAQEVKAGMNSLLTPFREIQPYIASQEKFLDPTQNKKLSRIILDLRTNFHQLENIPSQYHSLPGFKENVRSVAEMLDDSYRRFTENKALYAWWRIRKLPSDCFTCHATYKVESRYSNMSVVDQSLDTLNQARFMLATRQFSAAQEAFISVLKDPDYRLYFNEALRSILLITTRINRDPKNGATLLRELSRNPALPTEDAREAEGWANQLEAWAKEKPQKNANSMKRAEQLIERGSYTSPDNISNDVSLLRGTAILHQLLEDEKITPALRPRALYLLGFAYTKLPLFFSESWAEMYLERCISEYPGTATAQKAYRTYRELIIDDYTGTAGTEIPAEIKLHLEELRRKAYGASGFSPVVSNHSSQTARD